MLKINGTADAATIEQMNNCLSAGAVRGVLCADNHLGYAQPVGGVCAYRNAISISGVGYDIACGNMAVKLPVKYDEVKDRMKDIGREIQRQVSFGIGRTNETKVEADCLDDDKAWQNDFIKTLKDTAALQLGTVGGGNHYVDVFTDEQSFIWIGVHFGSRGLGHKSTTHFLKALGGKDGMMVAPTLVDMNSEIGEAYYDAMQLGGRYAYAGREWVCATVAKIIQGTAEFTDVIHNHHNFAWKEQHDGEELFVVRKGATPAFPGQRSFVGGSMLDKSVILRGTDTQAARDNLYSTVHGAGRQLSRTQAAGKFKGWGRNRKQVSPGLVDAEEMRARVNDNGVHLFGAGADEAPECYKDLMEVLSHHADSVEIETVLTPRIVVMARADEFDPFRD